MFSFRTDMVFRASEPIRIDIVSVFTLLLALAVAWSLATGLWIGAAAIVGAVAVALCALTWPGLLPILWILGTPTLFVMIDNALKGVPILTMERALFFAIATFLGARFLLRPGTLAEPGSVEKAMGLYLGVLVLTWLTHLSGKGAADLKDDFFLLLEAFVMPFTAFIVARNLDWDDRAVDRFAWALVLGVGGWLVATGLAQYALHWSFFIDNRTPIEHPDRVTGPFVNALEYGIVLVLVLMTTLYLYVRSRTIFARAGLLALMGAMLIALVLSKGRAVWLSVPLVFVLIFAKVPRLRKLIGIGAVIGVVAGLLLVPVIANPSDLGRRLGSSEEYYNRMALWGTALNMIAHGPLVGYGFGAHTFLHHKPDFYMPLAGVSAVWAAWPSVPHNELLHSAVLAGVFGVAGCVLLYASLWRSLGSAGRAATPGARRDLAPFVQAGLLAMIVNALFLDMMFLPYVLLLCFFLAGLVLRSEAGIQTR